MQQTKSSEAKRHSRDTSWTKPASLSRKDSCISNSAWDDISSSSNNTWDDTVPPASNAWDDTIPASSIAIDDPTPTSNTDNKHNCDPFFWPDESQALKAKSQLDEGGFYDSPDSACAVPFALRHGLLSFALELAKETLFHALREHWPKVQLELYPESPKQVCFGFGELNNAFGSYTGSPEWAKISGIPTNITVNDIVYGVIDLRNGVSHSPPKDNNGADKLMRRAQRLAVAFHDEARALQIRKLRDELQTEIIKSYKEIEAHMDSSATAHAEPEPWAVHHQIFLKSVREDRGFADSHKYSETVEKAATEWYSKYSSPGQLRQQVSTVLS